MLRTSELDMVGEMPRPRAYDIYGHSFLLGLDFLINMVGGFSEEEN